ncbi:MAG: ORF6N domain-containing protein [Bacteroidota bacterium]
MLFGTENKKEIVIADEAIMQKIYLIRGKRVMLDRDLAELYDYETKKLNQQVKRNAARFPENFMFQLTAEEVEHLRSQNVTANISARARSLPRAFTEHGLLMLASVLKSDTAIKASVRIVEVFVKMHDLILAHKDMLLQLEKLEQKQIMQHKDIQELYQLIRQFIPPPRPKTSPIGFRIPNKTSPKRATCT